MLFLGIDWYIQQVAHYVPLLASAVFIAYLVRTVDAERDDD